MKVTGKLTKTEGVLLAVGVLFLAALAVLFLRIGTLAQGTDYVIVTAREAPSETMEEVEAPAPDVPDVVDVNCAGWEELQILPGVGPVLAQRILDYRAEHGPFSSPEELLEVKGIGEATLAGFRDWIQVGLPADGTE